MISNGLLKEKVLKKYLIDNFDDKEKELLSSVCVLDNTKKTSGKELLYLDVKYLRGQSEGIFKKDGIEVNKGDFVILVDGENSGEVFEIPCQGYMGSTFKKLKFSEEVDKKYIVYFISLNKELLKGNKTGSAIPHLNKKLFASLELHIPLKNEQEEIVNMVDRFFDLVEKKELNDIEKENLKELLKSKILDSGLNATLINNDSSLNSVDIEEIVDDVPFKIPSNWKWCNLKNCCDKLYAGGDKTSRFSKDKTDEYKIPVVANGVTNDGIIGYTDVPTETDTCITISGRGTIGYTSFRNYPFSPVVRLITIKPNSFIDIKYLKYVMSYLVESSKGTSIQQLTIPMIKNKLIPVPPIEEQKRIVEKIESLFELIEQL